MLAIDTNVIIRYLTNDDPEQSPRARRLIDGQPVFVAVTVVLEAEWVLRSAYGYGQAAIVGALRRFGGLPTVELEDAAIVSSALDLSEAEWILQMRCIWGKQLIVLALQPLTAVS